MIQFRSWRVFLRSKNVSSHGYFLPLATKLTSLVSLGANGLKNLLLFLPIILSVARDIAADPLIVATIMVKNEEPVIVQTLQPLVEGGIDAFLIFDTGSTDQTIKKATDYLHEKGITHFHIMQEPFVDFSVSRNRALDLAEQHFPEANFILMPDAEWYLQNVKGLIEFCEQRRNDQEPAYLLRILQNGSLDYYNCRLIRCHREMRFKCPVHEYISYTAAVKIPETIFFAWNRTEYGSIKSAQRWIRDRDILLKNYNENPRDPRTVFYLAQTYACLNDQEKAYHFYKERALMGPGGVWDEETFAACYRLGEIIEILASKEGSTYDWSEALYYYLKAHAVRSCRAEPLVKIAQHYQATGNHMLAFLFISRALEIPYPEHDTLFVEKDMYVYTRYDIAGQSAWYIHEFGKGEEALRQGLSKNKGNQHLLNNLRFYVERKFNNGIYKVDRVPLGDGSQRSGQKMWSIMICTMTERKQQLDELVASLVAQIKEHNLENKIEILIFSDNRGECTIGYKRNKLMQASRGKYINFIDDDDTVHKNYIKMLYDKMHTDTDCIGLKGIRTQNGGNPNLFVHSLDYNDYSFVEGVFYRPPNHLNPIKRDKALQFPFKEVNWGEDTDWAMQVARSGCLKTEAKIDEPYYFYHFVLKEYYA